MADCLTTHIDRNLHEIARGAIHGQRFAQISEDPRAYTQRVDLYSGKCACRDEWLFAVARLDDRWFLILNIWNCFEFRTQNDVVPIAVSVLEMALEGCERSELLKRLNDQPLLRSTPDYCAHEWRLRARYWLQFGWQEISRNENDELDLWNVISRNFGFPCDALKFPKGFRQWNVAHWFRLWAVHQRVARAYHKAVVDALCAALSGNKAVLVMDWQHPCYRFEPQRMTRAADPGAWPVSLDSDGDSILLTSQDFRLGVFAGMCDHTVTIWGEQFLNAVVAQQPEFLSVELRNTPE